MDRPNILWICTDSQRADTLGCYGNSFVHSPNIDRLASEGVLFERCFAQNPLCTPSRGSMLTGRYPVTTRLRQNGQNIPPEERLVPRLLADNGYVCGLSGKLHLSACNRSFMLGEKWWEHPAEMQIVRGVERRIDDGYSEFHWDHTLDHNFRSSSYVRWCEEKGVTIDFPPRSDSKYVLHGLPSEHNQTTFCAEKAIGFIEAYAKSKHPWMFSVNIFDPHFSCRPPDAYFERYLQHLDTVPLPNYVPGELEKKPECQRAVHQNCKWGGYSESDSGEAREHRMLRAGYWAMCDLIDTQVGRMLDALQRTGQRENTIVIFTSDHGEMLGDHGLYIKGPFLYDAAVNVPLIISCPGTITAGLRTKALVELCDLAPTLLAGTNIPRYSGMQARSLWPLLTGRAPGNSFRDSVYSEYYNSNPDNPKSYLTMVRTEHYKLIVAHGTNAGEFYDLEKDPAETINRWGDSNYSSVKAEMLIKLCHRMAETADPLPQRVGIF